MLGFAPLSTQPLSGSPEGDSDNLVGSIVVSELSDTLSASGQLGTYTLVGSINVTEGSDILVAQGVVPTTGSANIIELDDIANITGGVYSPSDIDNANRTSVNKIADYLRSTGAFVHVQTNDLIKEWLLLEGIPSDSINQMLYKYLGLLGYSGALDDRMKKWSNS